MFEFIVLFSSIKKTGTYIYTLNQNSPLKYSKLTTAGHQILTAVLPETGIIHISYCNC